MSSRKGNASTTRCMRVSAISSTFPLGTATVCHASRGVSQLLSWLICSRLGSKRVCGFLRGSQQGEPVCDQDVEIERHGQGRHACPPVVPDQGPLRRNGLQCEQQEDAWTEQYQIVVPGDGRG